MKRTVMVLSAVAALTLAAATPAAAISWCFVAGLDGDAVVPPTDSPGSGHAAFFLDEDQMELSYFIEYAGVDAATSAGLYLGMQGMNGPLWASLPLASPIFGTISVTADQVQALFDTNVYFLVTSDGYPDGAIRGDVVFCSVPQESTTWSDVKTTFRHH